MTVCVTLKWRFESSLSQKNSLLLYLNYDIVSCILLLLFKWIAACLRKRKIVWHVKRIVLCIAPLLIRYTITACGFDIRLFYTVKNTLFSYEIQGYFTSYTCKHFSMINVFDGLKLRILIAVEQFQYCRCFACYFFWLQVHKMYVFNGGIFRKACAFISNFQAIYFRILWNTVFHPPCFPHITLSARIFNVEFFSCELCSNLKYVYVICMGTY